MNLRKYTSHINCEMAPTSTYPNNYFKGPIQNFLWIGLPLYEINEPKSKILYNIRFTVLIIIAWLYYCTEYIHMYKHLHELEEVTLTLCYIFAHTMAIGKLFFLIVKKKKIALVLRLLESGDFLPDLQRGGTKEIDIVSKAIRLTTIQWRLFGGIVTIMVAAGITPCLIHGRVLQEISPNVTKVVAKFPYTSSLPFDVDYAASPYYELMLIFQVFSTLLYGWYVGNSDVLNVGLMIHVTAQFKILINALENTTHRATKMTENEIVPESLRNQKIIKHAKANKTSYNTKFIANCRQCIKDCARHHQGIIALVGYIEDSLNGLILLQFLACLFTIVVGLYQSSLVPVNSPMFTNMSAFCVAIGFGAFINCWYGNEISVYSTEVAVAAYNCNWIDADDDIRKSVLLIILRAQRECYLTFGKFSKITLTTFLNIVKGSFSYFTYLQRLNDDVVN